MNCTSLIIAFEDCYCPCYDTGKVTESNLPTYSETVNKAVNPLNSQLSLNPQCETAVRTHVRRNVKVEEHPMNVTVNLGVYAALSAMNIQYTIDSKLYLVYCAGIR